MEIRLNLKTFLTCCLFCVSSHGFCADVHEYSFENGMKLIVKEDHRAPIVVSQVWYKVGGSYERAGSTGISHVLEHMMFKGTDKYANGEFSKIIAANGGSENAFTGSDYTAYFQTLERSRLHISFELEADRMRNLKLLEEEFEKEIEVVKEERRMRTEDKPSSYTYEVAAATAFQTSPYRNPIVGWMSDLDTMNVPALESWYQKWYAPNNATVVVVGDVEPDEVHALATKYFAPLPAEDIAIDIPLSEIPQQGIKRVTVKRSAEVPSILMAYKVPSLKTSMESKDMVEAWVPYALDVLTEVMNGGSSARFIARLVRGQEVAASMYADYSLTDRLETLYTIGGTPAQDKTVRELEEAIRHEILELQTDLVDEAELRRVKAQAVSEDVYQRDSAFYQGMIIGILETVGLNWELSNEYVERIQAITAEQVRDVARRYLIDDGLTVAELVPQAIENSVDAGNRGSRNEN
jgi:zinc protease